MNRSAWRLAFRGWLAVTVGVVLLSLASPGLPAQAQQEDQVFYTEMRLIGPLKTYAEARSSSAIKATLDAGSVVDVLTTGRIIGADGVMWARVRSPNGEDLGWAIMTEVNTAAGNEPYYGLAAYGTSYGTPYYDPRTGTIINPNTGIATPVSPYNPLTPYLP
jgi:hypothetical protein